MNSCCEPTNFFKACQPSVLPGLLSCQGASWCELQLIAGLSEFDDTFQGVDGIEC